MSSPHKETRAKLPVHKKHKKSSKMGHLSQDEGNSESHEKKHHVNSSHKVKLNYFINDSHLTEAQEET